MIEINDVSAWERARDIAATVDLSPNLFTTAIRVLRVDVKKGVEGLSPSGKHCLSVLLRSQACRMPIYCAAKVFRPSLAPKSSEFGPRELLGAFKPVEICAILGLLFVYRRARVACPAESFKFVADTLARQTDIGGMIGQIIPKIGFDIGLQVAALRQMGSMLFLTFDEKNFNKYRRAMKIQRLPYHFETEIETWGTTHLHIAAYLMQQLGLGLDLPTQVVEALLTKDSENLQTDKEHFYRFRVLNTWTTALENTGKLPEVAIRSDYYPNRPDLATLMAQIDGIRHRTIGHSWLEAFAPAETAQQDTMLEESAEMVKEIEEISDDVTFYDGSDEEASSQE